MKEIRIMEGSPTASVFIGLNAFNALVKANTLDEVAASLIDAHITGQMRYSKTVSDESNILSNEIDKYFREGKDPEAFFAEFSIKSDKPFLINPVQDLLKERLVNTFLEIRDKFEDQQSWHKASDESIASIVNSILIQDREVLNTKYSSVLNFLWKASDKDLLSIMNKTRSSSKKLSLNELSPNQGFIFNNNGHITLLVYKIINSENHYIHYNSISGLISYTSDRKEAESFILNNSAEQLQCYFCQPILELTQEQKINQVNSQSQQPPTIVQQDQDIKKQEGAISLISSEPSENLIRNTDLLSEQPQNNSDQPNEIELAAKNRQAEEKRKREEFIKLTAPQIDAVLDTLKDKIGTVSQHNYEEAFHLANQLLTDLNLAKIQYLNDLKQMDKKIGEINKQFNALCDALINTAKPVLERDLGWGTYLGNLLKAIARAIVWTATFGKVNTLFPAVRAELLKDVEETQSHLKPTEM